MKHSGDIRLEIRAMEDSKVRAAKRLKLTEGKSPFNIGGAVVACGLCFSCAAPNGNDAEYFNSICRELAESNFYAPADLPKDIAVLQYVTRDGGERVEERQLPCSIANCIPLLKSGLFESVTISVAEPTYGTRYAQGNEPIDAIEWATTSSGYWRYEIAPESRCISGRVNPRYAYYYGSTDRVCLEYTKVEGLPDFVFEVDLVNYWRGDWQYIIRHASVASNLLPLKYSSGQRAYFEDGVGPASDFEECEEAGPKALVEIARNWETGQEREEN